MNGNYYDFEQFRIMPEYLQEALVEVLTTQIFRQLCSLTKLLTFGNLGNCHTFIKTLLLVLIFSLLQTIILVWRKHKTQFLLGKYEMASLKNCRESTNNNQITAKSYLRDELERKYVAAWHRRRQNDRHLVA